MRAAPRPRDAGSGTLLGVALIGGLSVFTLLLIPLGVGLEVRERVGQAADAAALAAADVAVGIAPGYPCEVAGEVAAANHADLAACRVDGLIVTVRAEKSFSGIRIASTSSAGPPRVVTN